MAQGNEFDQLALNYMDTDRDGRIGRAEFNRYWPGLPGYFDQFDYNSDGVLIGSEVESAALMASVDAEDQCVTTEEGAISAQERACMIAYLSR